MSEREKAVNRLRELLEDRPELCEIVMNLAKDMKAGKETT